MDSHHLRAIILKLQDSLSDDDRKRLHFFLGPDVPRRIRDDQSLTGTLSLMESLFDQDKINEQDFTFLINAFDEIQCRDAVKMLREHMRRMQANGQNESIQSLTSILLQDQDEDKFAIQNTIINQENSYGDNNIMIDSNQTNINPVTVIVNKQPLKLNQKRRLKSLTMTIQVLLLLILLLIIVLIVAMSVCLKKINRLEKELETKNTAIFTEQTKNNKSIEEIQWLINDLNICKQRLTMVHGSTYGDVDGGVPFDDATDLKLSAMTPCLGAEVFWSSHLFAIRFIYESNDTSNRKVYHGNNRNLHNANSSLSSEKFLMSNKERINKVTLYAGTGAETESHVFFRQDNTIVRYIMGIQFYTTTGRKSPLYGVRNGEEFTESYAGYILGYVKGRSGLVIDMLQFVWYGQGHLSTIYNGVWVEGKDGSIPLHALMGGTEGNRQVHIVRFKTKEGDMVPGKLVEGSKVAEGPYWGVQTSSTYQVLTNSNSEQKWKWINTVGQNMPKDAFLAGKEGDINLYVGRVILHSGSILVGKYHQPNGRVYVTHEGQQKEFLKDFEVLCAS